MFMKIFQAQLAVVSNISGPLLPRIWPSYRAF